MDTAQEVIDLETKARQLQGEERFFDALEALEEALAIQKDMHGVNSPQFTRTCRQVCETCNVLAVHYLRNEDVDNALTLLRRSEQLSETNQQCRAMTYNNMACYYRRIGKLKTALNYLQKALSIETELPKVQTQADTHLNVCAVLSQLNKHDIALTHAMSAVSLLQEEQLKRQFGFAIDQDYDVSEEGLSKLQRDRASVLAIAYHNMGVQQEFLKAYDNALLSYRKAVLYAEQNLGEEDSITQNLRNVYLNARTELRTLENKLTKKKGSNAIGGIAAQAAPVYAKKDMMGYTGHSSGYKMPPDQYHPGPEMETEEKQEDVTNPDISDMMTSRDQMEEKDEQQETKHE